MQRSSQKRSSIQQTTYKGTFFALISRVSRPAASTRIVNLNGFGSGTKAPTIENIFGFVEPYRDPHGIGSEFEGLVAIANQKETELLATLVENSAKFIRRLPWATSENDVN